MKSIDKIQNEILEEFSLFTNWSDKYQHIIDMGSSIPVIDSQYKNNEHLIKGCQSDVWLHGELKDGNLYFTADSDAAITKGIISMLLRVYNNHTPQEILKSELYLLNKIDLQSHLSPNRANGLMQMIHKIKGYAEQYSS